MAKTPPPWTIYDDADPLRVGIKGFTRPIGAVHVATVIMPENAELIVKAVNNHDALVKALEAAEVAYQALTSDRAGYGYYQALEDRATELRRAALAVVGGSREP